MREGREECKPLNGVDAYLVKQYDPKCWEQGVVVLGVSQGGGFSGRRRGTSNHGEVRGIKRTGTTVGGLSIANCTTEYFKVSNTPRSNSPVQC